MNKQIISLTQQIQRFHLKSPLKKNVIRLLVFVPLSLGSICKFYVIITKAYSHPLKYLKWSFLKRQLTAEIRKITITITILTITIITITITIDRRVLNTLLDDISRLDKSSKFVLLGKPSVFIVLSIILNQSKTKTIPRTAFETFINNNSRCKPRNIRKNFFVYIVYSVYSGFLQFYKVFSLKMKKESPKR